MNIIQYSKGRVKMFLYCFITENRNFVKIGISHDANRRLNEINSCCPLKVNVFAYKKLQKSILRDGYLKQEKEIHKFLEEYRVEGKKEWFHVKNIELLKSLFEGGIISERD
jgi:hypothetical protein